MIGIFDSGSGGLSVLRALREVAPMADVVYFGDLKNAPYGNKSREEIGALTVMCIEKLIKEGATEIVSACNSVSVSIVLPMFEILDLPHANIIEMVGPTISSFKKREAKVLVVATKATVESGVYQEGFRMIGVEADGMMVPDLVTLIEQGVEYDAMYPLVYTAIAPYAQKGYTHVLLGCTHYPLVLDVFASVLLDLDMSAELVDPAHAVVAKVGTHFCVEGQGRTQFLLSKDSTFFRNLADRDSFGIHRTFEEV